MAKEQRERERLVELAGGWRGEDAIAVPEVGEGVKNERVVARRVEGQELVEQVVEVVPCVDLLLHHHLHHRLAEVRVRLRRFHCHRHALPCQPPVLLLLVEGCGRRGTPAAPALLPPLPPRVRLLMTQRWRRCHRLLVHRVGGDEGGGAPRVVCGGGRCGTAPTRGGGRERRGGRRRGRRVGGLGLAPAAEQRRRRRGGGEDVEQLRAPAVAADVHHRWLPQREAPDSTPGRPAA
jgi:hypothetical protein